MRLATWNVNSVVVRLPRLADWLASSRPDILCLQETKVADDAFPRSEVEALGYELALHGDGRWNGVAIISRAGLADVVRGFDGEPGFPGPEARAVSATCGGLRVWCVYVPNGRALPHNRLTTDGARHALAALRRRMGTDPEMFELFSDLRSPHAARHTAATTLLEATDGDVRLVQEVLGHANLNTLQGYTKIVDARKQEAYERYQEFLDRKRTG